MMEEEDELLPAISSSPLFGVAHRQHLLSLYDSQTIRNKRRRMIIATFAVIYFGTRASNSALGPFFPVKVSEMYL